MQKTILFFALMIAASSSVLAQEKEKLSSTRTDQQDVLSMARELANSIVKRDTAAMERLLADNFMDVSPIGVVSSRSQFVAEYKDPPANAPKFEAAEVGVSDSKVRLFGDTAVMTTRITWRGQVANEQTFTSVMATTMVAVKKGEQWQIASTHSSRIAPTNE